MFLRENVRRELSSRREQTAENLVKESGKGISTLLSYRWLLVSRSRGRSRRLFSAKRNETLFQECRTKIPPDVKQDNNRSLLLVHSRFPREHSEFIADYLATREQGTERKRKSLLARKEMPLGRRNRLDGPLEREKKKKKEKRSRRE